MFKTYNLENAESFRQLRSLKNQKHFKFIKNNWIEKSLYVNEKIKKISRICSLILY